MIAAALVVGAVAWTYGRVVSGLVAEWASSPDASYGLVLAIAAFALLWQRRHTIRHEFAPSPHPTPGLAVLLSGTALFVVGQLGADLFLTRLSVIVVIVGAVWLLAGGRALRTVAAPIGFLAMAVPLPAILVNTITLPMQLVASRVAESTLALAGVPVFRDGNLLVLPSATLQVAEACSGLRSLVSLTAIAILLAWMTDTNALRRAALAAIALPIAIVVNGWRIAATGFACETFGPRAATGAWHEATGWAAFVCSLALLGLAQRVFERSTRATRSEASPSIPATV